MAWLSHSTVEFQGFLGYQAPMGQMEKMGSREKKETPVKYIYTSFFYILI